MASNLVAELLVIEHGLLIARCLCYRIVILESDSRTALDLIEDTTQGFHPLASLLNCIHRFRSMDWLLSFLHTLREGNECADWLTKHGAASDVQIKMWDSCPSQISCVILVDAIGHSRVRL